MLNCGPRFSAPESEWPEIEVNSASSLTTTQVRASLVGEEGGGGEGMAMTHQGWTKFVWHLNEVGSRTRKTMTNGQVERRILLHCTEEILGQL